jgi:gliding motility-associated-like protein
VTEPPQLTANAGADFIVCGQSAATLSAAVPVGGIGFWQVVASDSTIIFTDSTSVSAVISNLGTGDNILLWTVTDGICSASDQLVVTSATEIQAIGGIDRRVCGDNVNLNATRPEFGYGYWTSLTTGTEIADSTKAFTAVTGIAYGVNSFLWTVVNGTCRDSVVVNITRRDTLDCLPRVELPTAFSPNFDGSNDYLVIKGLDEYPDNEVLIYNRWGQLVYSTSGYRNDWYGLDRNGYPLADGTYFVIVKVNYINKVYNTYIDLRR